MTEQNSFESVVPPKSRRVLLRNLKTERRPPAWDDSHINKVDIEKIDSAIRFHSSGLSYCPFESKNCIKPNTRYNRFIEKRFQLLTREIEYDEWSKLPNISSGSWGSCALIGLADTMLKSRKGREIDAHDTVIRLGELPLRGYEAHVGTKTDITWARRRAKMSQQGKIAQDRRHVKLYIGHDNGVPDMPLLKVFDYVLEKSVTKDLNFSKGFASYFYELFEDKNWKKWNTGKKKKRAPSTGFRDALLLIFSGFCKRTDLYGFSDNCGGAYYNTKHHMQILHNCEMESWILHYLMKEHQELGACVYL